jgi:hypothetical protein
MLREFHLAKYILCDFAHHTGLDPHVLPTPVYCFKANKWHQHNAAYSQALLTFLALR